VSRALSAHSAAVRLRWVENAYPVLIAERPAELVDVSLVFDSTPQMERHRVTVSNGGGVICWMSDGAAPVILQFASGEVLAAHASIAARRGAKSKARPSRSWRLRAQPGGTAVLRLETRDRVGQLDRLEIHVAGAKLDR
jgi:hypothetical protein